MAAAKPAIYTIVGVYTMLTCLLWMPVLAAVRLSGEIPLSMLPQMPVGAWAELWSRSWRLLLLCAGLGLVGLFLSRRKLLAYVSWYGKLNTTTIHNGRIANHDNR